MSLLETRVKTSRRIFALALRTRFVYSCDEWICPNAEFGAFRGRARRSALSGRNAEIMELDTR